MITINYENDDFLFKRIVLEQMNYMAVNVFIIKPGVKIYTKTIKDPKKKFNCRRLLELNEIKKGNQIVNPAGKKNYGIFIKPAENGLSCQHYCVSVNHLVYWHQIGWKPVKWSEILRQQRDEY